VLQPAEQALDNVTLLIEMPIAGALLKPVAPQWNHRLNLTHLPPGQKFVGVTALVGQQRQHTDPLQKRDRLGDIGHLASRQMKRIGRPNASVSVWILHSKPPRERSNASSEAELPVMKKPNLALAYANRAKGQRLWICFSRIKTATFLASCSNISQIIYCR
jgi:hypothetical protein